MKRKYWNWFRINISDISTFLTTPLPNKHVFLHLGNKYSRPFIKKLQHLQFGHIAILIKGQIICSKWLPLSSMSGTNVKQKAVCLTTTPVQYTHRDCGHDHSKLELKLGQTWKESPWRCHERWRLDVFCCVLWLGVKMMLRHSETPLLQSLSMVFNQKIMWHVTMLSTPISNPALAERLFTLWSLTHAVHGNTHPHAAKMDSKSEDWMQPVMLTGLVHLETSCYYTVRTFKSVE